LRFLGGKRTEAMDYDAITALAKHHKQVFGRIVKCEMYRLEGGKMLALSRMHDDYHDMNLAILLDENFHIEEIGGKMDRIPYPCCERKPLEMLASLAGIGVLERGGLKRVKERIPRNLGCTHIYEMIESTFRAIFVGSYSIHGQKWEGVLSLDLEENRQLALQSPVLADTCHAFHRDSVDDEVVARARRKVEEAGKKMAAIEAVKRGE
jgi:hypothetical protein